MDDWLLAKLRQINHAARQTREFVEGLDRSEFVADERTHKACSLNLIIIGEAAARILERDPEMAERVPEIAWRRMAGMRNRIAHGYERIDLEVVWETITDFLPELVSSTDSLLS